MQTHKVSILRSRKLVATIAAMVMAAVVMVGCGATEDESMSSVVVVTETKLVVVPPSGGTAAEATTTESGVSAAAFTGDWVGHTRNMALNADGSGTMEVFSGASNGERWALSWEVSDEAIMLALTTRESMVGTGAGGAMYQGATYRASLAVDTQDITYLSMTGFGGAGNTVAWCNTARYGGSAECGA